MKTDLFQSCGHCWVFRICWHIECSTFTASSFRIWNSSTGIPSPPLALFIVMLSKAHLTSHFRMSGSRWVITSSWLSGSWRSFLYLACRSLNYECGLCIPLRYILGLLYASLPPEWHWCSPWDPLWHAMSLISKRIITVNFSLNGTDLFVLSLSHLHKLRPRCKPIKKKKDVPWQSPSTVSRKFLFFLIKKKFFWLRHVACWDLSLRYHTHAPVRGSGNSQPLDHQEFPENLLLNHFNFSPLSEITIRFCTSCYRN